MVKINLSFKKYYSDDNWSYKFKFMQGIVNYEKQDRKYLTLNENFDSTKGL